MADGTGHSASLFEPPGLAVGLALRELRYGQLADSPRLMVPPYRNRRRSRIRQCLQSVGDPTKVFGRGARAPLSCTDSYTGRAGSLPMPKRNSSDLDFRGDLQTQVMAAVWKLGDATVEAVRAEQPRRGRSAYTTIQTVLNRLVDRGLLSRERQGRAFVYRPRVEESEYLTRSIGERLAGASPTARRAALVNLVDDLEPGELEEVARRASEIKRSRSSR
jgi:predicted transcriptional regulator